MLFGLIVVLLGGAATAVNASETGSPAPVVAKEEYTTQAYSCAAGDFCVWDQLGGVGNRCAWDVADPDWRAGAIRCSWSGVRKVLSAKDNGNDSRFLAVAVFHGADYNPNTRFACLQRGVPYDITEGGVFLRSHRWVNYYC